MGALHQPAHPATAVATPAPTGRSAWLPAGTDLPALLVLLAAWLVLYVPTYSILAERIWPRDEQGHGPLILAVSAYLLFAKRHRLAALPARPELRLGYAMLIVGALMYALGRSQFIIFFEVFSQIPVLTGILLVLFGRRSVRLLWFPLAFLLFMVPLPGSIVAELTAPLKSAVSAVATDLLYAAGYPIGRSGVILHVGPYQLLVADACAGLTTMFTLEAMGLLYMNLMNHVNALRNALLALLIVPIAFVANVVRVVTLVLVTYHLGDEAGQGFVHGFAGIVLFLAGLALVIAADKLLALVLPDPERA